METKKANIYEIKVLLLAVCLFYVISTKAQSNILSSGLNDSLNGVRNHFTPARKSLQKFAKQDSLLLFKKVKISSSVTAETHYYGLQYENSTFPSWTSTYKFNNNIIIGMLPFTFDAFLGDKVGIPGRDISRFQLRFDAETFVSNLAKKAIEEQQKNLLKELQSDSSFQKYKQASEDYGYLQDKSRERSYQQQIQNQKKLVQQYESIGDSSILKKEIYKNAKKNVDRYNKEVKDVDSLKQYLAYTEKVNPVWKTLKDSTADFSKAASGLNQKQCVEAIENSKLVPAPLKWLSHIKRIEAGMVFPDFQPLLFKGAPLKGVLVSIQKKMFFADAAYGKLYAPGDFFVDSFVSSKVYALAIRSGIQGNHFKINYSILQTRRINTPDTFAFRYYFESPLNATVHGVSVELGNTRNKLWFDIAKSATQADLSNGNLESARENDINRYLPDSALPLIATSAFQAGYKIGFPRFGNAIILKYNYQGQYYFSPMRVFTQPPGTSYEASIEQTLFKKKVQFKGGIVLSESEFNNTYLKYHDRTVRYNFQLLLRLKKLPTLTVSYLPYYRTSIYKNELVTLKMEQLTITEAYLHQKKNNFISIVGSYSQIKIENIFNGNYQQASVFGTYKNLKSPLGYNLMFSFYNRPGENSDSTRLYDTKATLEYQILPKLNIRFGGGYAISKEKGRCYPYFDLNWENIYLGKMFLRMDYTWLNEYGVYHQGMNITAGITRRLF